MKSFIIIVLGLFFLSSCVNTKKFGVVRIPKGQHVFVKEKIQYPANNGESLRDCYKIMEVKLLKPAFGKKEINKSNDIQISDFITKPSLDTVEIKDSCLIILSATEKDASYFFPYRKEADFVEVKDVSTKNVSLIYKLGQQFKFRESRPIFQAVSIPFKIRPAIDSIDYKVSTGVNLGFAFGFQTTWNKYRKIYVADNNGNKNEYKSVNYQQKKYSITPALILGVTPVELNKKNTENQITEDRTVFGANIGIMGVVGINQFNIGVASGVDFGFGEDAKDWIYQGQPWVGFVLALDFVK